MLIFGGMVLYNSFFSTETKFVGFKLKIIGPRCSTLSISLANEMLYFKTDALQCYILKKKMQSSSHFFFQQKVLLSLINLTGARRLESVCNFLTHKA